MFKLLKQIRDIELYIFTGDNKMQQCFELVLHKLIVLKNFCTFPNIINF